MELSDKIRIIRKARGFSQEELGNKLSMTCESGISRQAVSEWENGNTEPKLINIRDLAKVLNVSYDALLDEELDLNDTNVLTAVLNKVSTARKNQVNSKFRYSLYANAVTIKTYKNCITCGVYILLTICFALLTNVWNGFRFFAIFSGAMCIVFLPVSLKDMFRIFKGRVEYWFGELNNTHLIMHTIGSAENTLYIPIEKIEFIKLGNMQKKKSGSVEIKIAGRANSIIIVDLMNPQKFIDIFDSFENYAQKEDLVKIL